MASIASTMPPRDVAIMMIEHGVVKHRTRLDMVFFKAVIAGLLLSTGGLLLEIIEGGSTSLNTDNPGLVKILGGAVFPVGLIMIVLTGQELLTSNMMVFPMACIKGAVPWWGLAVNWIVVLFGNLAGSLFFASVLVKYSGVISTAPYEQFVQDFAIKKAGTPNFLQIFLRGIACNWLVCIAVWQGAGARETISKIFAIWIPIWIFVACGYDHVVGMVYNIISQKRIPKRSFLLANMFLVPVGILFGAPLSAAAYIRKSLIAAFLGNVIGALFVVLPSIYFYLWDFDYVQDVVSVRGVEEGEGLNELTSIRGNGVERNGSGNGSLNMKAA